MAEGKTSRKLTVGEGEIADVVSGWTKIPVRKLAEEESERLRKLESILHERVVGQEEAVTAVAKSHPQRPRGLKRPETPDWFLLIPGTDWGRKNRTLQSAGRSHVWH